MLVAGYHKGFSKSERLKVIHRFLPREISILVIYYLWLVLPYWEDLQANVWEVTELIANLWAPEETLDGLDENDGKDGYDTGPETGEGERSGGDDPTVESEVKAHRL
ncbi:hypothetical protein FDECE_18691, partial [Fusarium decemcellulare]